jgi:hypothetical protein
MMIEGYALDKRIERLYNPIIALKNIAGEKERGRGPWKSRAGAG